MDKLIIPCIYLEQEKAKTGFGSKEDFSQSNPKLLAKTYGNGGADELLVFDFSMEDADHEGDCSNKRNLYGSRSTGNRCG